MGRQKTPEWKLAEIAHMAELGFQPKIIAEEVNVSLPTVYKILHEQGVNLARIKDNAANRLGERVEEFFEDYYNWMPNLELIEKYELKGGYNDIYSILRAFDKTARNFQKSTMEAKKARLDRAIQTYIDRPDVPIRAICDEYGIDQTKLHFELGRRGVELRRAKAARLQNDELERLKQLRR